MLHRSDRQQVGIAAFETPIKIRHLWHLNPVPGHPSIRCGAHALDGGASIQKPVKEVNSIENFLYRVLYYVTGLPEVAEQFFWQKKALFLVLIFDYRAITLWCGDEETRQLDRAETMLL